GSPLSGICQAVSELAARFPDTAFVWPVHPNPDVRSVVTATLGNTRGVYLIPPAEYPEFVWLMDQSSLILTDSGGVQEEAPSLGKPVLVLRQSTERPEAAQCGAVELVGHRPADIVARAAALLSDDARPNSLHAR